MARLNPGRDRGSKVIQPTTSKHFAWKWVHLALYAPWWAPSRSKRELGFMIRVMDPRTRCAHHCKPSWIDGEHVWCGRCCARLEAKPGTMTITTVAPQPRWRWMKVFVAKTSPDPKKRTRHGVMLGEAETHLTEGLVERVTVKTFIRLKFGVGGRHV